MLEQFQVRMVAEYNELDARINKLEEFVASDKFTGLNVVEQKLQKWQLSSMKSYREALKERCLCQGFDPKTGNELEG